MDQDRHTASAEDYLAAAKQFLDQGQPDAAEKVYKQLLETASENVSAHLGLFQIYQARGETETALQSLVSALELEPLLLQPAEHVNLGSQLFAVGKFEQALDCCLRCISLDPELIEGHLLMCEAYLKIGQFSQAVRALRRAILVDRALGEMDNKQHFRSSIPYKIWKIENCVAELSDDYELCGEVISKTPNIADEHYYLARTHAAQGDLEKSAYHYRKAIESRPTFAEAHFNLGCVLHAWQRGADRHEFLPDAHQAFEQASELSPTWAQAHLKRAIVGKQLTPSIDPLVALDQALQLQPDLIDAHLQKGMYYYCLGQVDKSFE